MGCLAALAAAFLMFWILVLVIALFGAVLPLIPILVGIFFIWVGISMIRWLW